MTLKSNSAFLAGNDRFEGYLADILRLLATSVGFDYEIRVSLDGKHGQLHADSAWDGMIGMVQRRVTSLVVVTKITTRTGIIDLRFKKTRTKSMMVQKTNTTK